MIRLLEVSLIFCVAAFALAAFVTNIFTVPRNPKPHPSRNPRASAAASAAFTSRKP